MKNSGVHITQTRFGLWTSTYITKKAPKNLGTARQNAASMGKRVFEPEELERSAAAGDPRHADDFAGDADAWRSYQDQWFATFTGGEALPPVGDQNRAKRWKASKRQHKSIED